MEKKLLVVLVVVGLCSTVALAFDPMGPPAAGLGKGKTSLGIEYIWNKMEIERNLTSWSSAERTPKLKMHKIYANLGYGLADNVDVFVRAGAAWADYELTANYDWELEGECSFVYGGGFKVTLAEEPGIKWGFLAQYSWNQLRGDADIGDDDYSGNWDMTLDELQIAFGPTWTPSQGLSIYGGPFIHTIRGYEEFSWDGDTNRHAISDENWLGGYIGLQAEVAQNCAFNIEWMMTADDMAGAVGLVFRQ
jgi:opacity protein-like surface antigen